MLTHHFCSTNYKKQRYYVKTEIQNSLTTFKKRSVAMVILEEQISEYFAKHVFNKEKMF